MASEMNISEQPDGGVALLAVIPYIPSLKLLLPARILGFQRNIQSDRANPSGTGLSRSGKRLEALNFLKTAFYSIALYTCVKYGEQKLPYWLALLIVIIVGHALLQDPASVRYVRVKPGAPQVESVTGETG